MAGRYTAPATPGSGPIAGALGRPTSMQPRPGIQRVPVKSSRRKAEPEYYEPEEIADEVPADDLGTEEIGETVDVSNEVYDNGATRSPQGCCCFCGATEKDGVLVEAPIEKRAGGLPPVMVCDQCTDKLIDAVRAELPRRRLRLAMERLAAGAVSLDVVEQIEKLAAGQYPVKTDE